MIAFTHQIYVLDRWKSLIRAYYYCFCHLYVDEKYFRQIHSLTTKFSLFIYICTAYANNAIFYIDIIKPPKKSGSYNTT